MIPMIDFAKRREQLLKQIGPRGLVILASAPVVRRNGDYDYPYRPDSDFYYLTGFEEPEAVALLFPGEEGKFIVFNRVRNRDEEIWEGKRAGLEGACQLYGANVAYPITELEQRLPELLEGRAEIHYTLGCNQSFDSILMKALNKLRHKVRNGVQSPFAFIDIGPTIHEMRLIKSSSEIALMRKAAEISAKAHERAMRFCKPGIKEYQLEAELNYVFHQAGARFSAYGAIVGSGANSCILHYNTNNQTIEEGCLVLIDAGCEFHYYASDITRTFPANGHFSPEQKAVYEIVLAAQKAGIEKIKPGLSWPEIQNVIVTVLTQGLLDLGILKGDLTTLIQAQAYSPYYMHKSGHWLGLDTHDVGRYKRGDQWRTLEAGMVLTVEPGLYLSADIPGLPDHYKNIGIRIEDDILVTKEGFEILSKDVVKEVSDIEALMASH